MIATAIITPAANIASGRPTTSALLRFAGSSIRPVFEVASPRCVASSSMACCPEASGVEGVAGGTDPAGEAWSPDPIPAAGYVPLGRPGIIPGGTDALGAP